jgi:Cu2+-exporting ATPase
MKKQATEHVAQDIACRHCSTPFAPGPAENEFCCGGCRYVYQLIHHKGLDQFYELKNKTTPPVGSSVFHQPDLDWLSELIKAVETAATAPELELEVQGISCVGCVWLIERVFQDQAGTRHIRVMPNHGKLRMGWERGKFDVLAFIRDLESLGYRTGPMGTQSSKKLSALSPLLTRLGLCAALALNAMLFSLPFYLGMERDNRLAPLLTLVAFLLATGSIAIGGSYFFRRCWISLKLRELHIDLPISLGLLAAYFGSLIGWATDQHSLLYFDFVAVFSALMLTGRYLQEQAIEKNRRRLLSSSTWTQRWHVWRDGKQSSREAHELLRGDRVTVRPGQVVPVQGTLLKQSAMIGLDWITGESKPFLAQPGTSVPSGAINVATSRITIESTEDWQNSPLKQLMDVSDQSFAPNPLLEKIIRIYLAAVLIIALGGALLWLASGAAWPVALQIAISVLVVSCPCALGIALPLADELAVKAARSIGVFVRESSLWHRLSTIQNIVFDKTGTVTLETPALTDERVLNTLQDDERRILLNMVSTSPHPASKALRESLQKYTQDSRPEHPEGIVEIPGSGLEWSDGEIIWRVGKPQWALSGPFPQRSADCVFTRNGIPIAQFNYTEEVRQNAHQEMKALIQQGFEVFLLSGDNPQNVRRMAALLSLPLENAIGGQSPEAKAAWIRSRPVDSCLMVGDGANDSLAFNEAHCRATPAVHRGLLEQKSDFYFLGKNLNGIRKVFQIAEQRTTVIRRILIFTVSYNLLAVGCALAGWINPLVAAIIMPISSILSLLICSTSQSSKS